MGWGVVRLLKNKNDYNALKKITLCVGLAAFFITEMTRSFWRPYVYKNEIFDYYFLIRLETRVSHNRWADCLRVSRLSIKI